MRVDTLVAACYSAACRPPTSGGTGGSSPAPTTRKFDKALRSRSPAVRAAAEKVLAESIYRGDTKLYHGSMYDIKIGDIIRPGDSAGAMAAGLKKAAFATRHIDTSVTFGRLGTVYQVEPVKQDLKFLPTTDLGVHVASPSGFRVVGIETRRPTSRKEWAKGGEHRQRQEALQRARERRRVPRYLHPDDPLTQKIEQLVKSLGDRGFRR